MNYLNGMEVVKSNLFVKGSRQKKTHKSKRINKKWRRKYGFIDIPDKQVYAIDNKICGHPITINKMLKFIKQEG
jgi:plasmid maintenance system killer protein